MVVQAAGLGFAAQIAANLWSISASYAAARRMDIAAHRRCMVRMAGLAYGVLPFKQNCVAIFSLNGLPGTSAPLYQRESHNCLKKTCLRP